MIMVFRAGTRRAFVSVVVPILMLLPTDFYVRLPHSPPLGFEDAILACLGISMILMDIHRWKFSRADIWMTVFVVSSAYSERLPWGINGAFLALVGTILQGFVPYMVGKLLIEQPGVRVETVKSVVKFMSVACILSIPQYFLKINPHMHFWSHFFPGQFPEAPQIRSGAGRVAGPYGVAESAGMVLMIGLFLALWLQRCTSSKLDVIGHFSPPPKIY